MRWIICCAGAMSRWNNYLGIPKHLIKIDGETLISRTTRLIKQYDNDHDILIIALNNKYKISDTQLIKIKPDNLNKHYNTLPFKTVLEYSSDSKKNIMIFGDIFFSEKCIQTMVNTCNSNFNNVTFFGREKKSSITLCPYGELWGIYYSYEHINLIKLHIFIIELRYMLGLVFRIKHWELYRSLNDIDLRKHIITNNFVEIDDFTEDFDFPEDYDRWIKQYKTYKIKNNKLKNNKLKI
jgi:choline kinase